MSRQGAAGVPPSIGSTDGGAATIDRSPERRVVDPARPRSRSYAAMLELADPAEDAQRLGDLARRHAELFTWAQGRRTADQGAGDSWG